MADATPSPVRQVRQYLEDEVKAAALQQSYIDENSAHALQEILTLEDEFDEATARVNAERDAKALRKFVASSEQEALQKSAHQSR